MNLNAIIEQNSAQANEKEISLLTQVESEPNIHATDAIMNMLIGNLIRNAIAATSSNGKVHITLTDSQISIEDEGEGLQEQYNPNGHGLGLLVVEDLCNRFEWDFELKNRPTGGCVAQIIFKHEFVSP